MCYYKLRPHHGMCLAFYEGKGYSRDFIENMNCIAARLQENPVITLWQGCDDLCKCCPNAQDANANDCEKHIICRSSHLVQQYDQAVLDACGLHYNDKLSYHDFYKLVQENILSKPLFHHICGNCQWHEICHKKPR